MRVIPIVDSRDGKLPVKDGKADDGREHPFETLAVVVSEFLHLLLLRFEASAMRTCTCPDAKGEISLTQLKVLIITLIILGNYRTMQFGRVR
ncbi:MAG TPA: hypothetical protein VGK01_16350 [Candidatus Angelobacter sp.]